MAKRITTEDDIRRLSERINTFSEGAITDKTSYDRIYNDFMGDDLSAKQNKMLRNDVFKSLRERFPNRISEQRLRRETPTKEAPKRDFSQVGRVKGKVVFGRIAKFRIKGKPVTRFRDKKGHFISIKK